MQDGVGQSLAGETVFAYEGHGGLKEACSVRNMSLFPIYFEFSSYEGADLTEDMKS